MKNLMFIIDFDNQKRMTNPSSQKHQYIQAESLDESDKNQDIFSKAFNVDSMENPQQFLPNQQQSVRLGTADNECLNCCGCIWIACSLPFSLCGCSNSYFFQVPTSFAGLVQKFGKFDRLSKPGFNIRNPCSQEFKLVDLRLKVMNVGKHQALTKDNVKITIEASVSFRVVNPIISHYVLGNNLIRSLIELTVASLRDNIGIYTLQQVLLERMEITQKSKVLVLKGIPPGIRVENVFIEQIIIPPQIEKDLTSAARQKRLSEATIINSQADVESAGLMKQQAELLNSKAAMQIRYLQMVQELGKKGVMLLMDIGVDKKGYKG